MVFDDVDMREQYCELELAWGDDVVLLSSLFLCEVCIIHVYKDELAKFRNIWLDCNKYSMSNSSSNGVVRSKIHQLLKIT